MHPLLTDPELIIEPTWETKGATDYAVRRPSGEPIAGAREQTLDRRPMWQILLGSWISPACTVRFSDLSGGPLLHVSTSRAVRPSAAVSTGANGPLGTYAPGGPFDQEGALFDPYGAQTGIVRRPAFEPEIVMTDRSRARLASITVRPLAAIWNPNGLGPRHFVLRLAPQLSGPRRALVVGVVVTLYMIWFRKSRRSSLRRW